MGILLVRAYYLVSFLDVVLDHHLLRYDAFGHSILDYDSALLLVSSIIDSSLFYLCRASSG